MYIYDGGILDKYVFYIVYLDMDINIFKIGYEKFYNVI